MIGVRIADALRTACHPPAATGASVLAVDGHGLAWIVPVSLPDPATIMAVPTTDRLDVSLEPLLIELFRREGRSLVRLARLFVDDRNAAETRACQMVCVSAPQL
ncbi:MAG: hypothetical protein ACRDRT_07365 [Pseudonocardiaceae bacterium]